MTSPVLLARPHAFIVSDMKPFLEEAGFKVIKTESLPQLADLSRGCVGAVISLALSSPINASPEEVIKSLRQANPGLPPCCLTPRPRTTWSASDVKRG